MEAIAPLGAHIYFPSSTRRRHISIRTRRFVGLPYDGGNGLLPAGGLRLQGSWSCHRSPVQDDLDSLLAILPKDLQEGVVDASKRSSLVEIILDLGRLPEARYHGESRGQAFRRSEVTVKELEYVLHAVGGFLGDNRAGIPGTLHRISAIKNREGAVVGLTCRIGRAVNGAVNMVHDLLNYGKNILFVGRGG